MQGPERESLDRLALDLCRALDDSPEDLHRLLTEVFRVLSYRTTGTDQYRPVDSYLYTMALLADRLHELDASNPEGPCHASDDISHWMLQLPDDEIWAAVKCGLVVLERREQRTYRV